MRRYSKSLLINWSTNIERIFYPSDLFEFNIALLDAKDVEMFTEFINNLSELKGCYFNRHFMHRQLMICRSRIQIETQFLDEIEIFIDKMKAIKITNKINSRLDLPLEETLFDTDILQLHIN